MSSSDAGVVARNVAAGALATAIAVSIFNPLDTLRIKYQVRPDRDALSAAKFARRIIAAEGVIGGLWLPGLGVNACSVAVSSGIRLGFYPSIRDALVGDANEKNGFDMVFAGLAAGALGFFIATPLFQLKVLTQAEHGLVDPKTGRLTTGSRAGAVPRFQGSAMSGLSRMPALYSGASVLCVRGALLSAGAQLGYDGSKTLMQSRRAENEEETYATHVCASVVSAFLATSFSAPADFVMTKYQASKLTRSPDASPLRTLVRVVSTSDSPFTVLFTGWTTFFVRVAPLFLISMPLYEQTRKLLGIGFTT